MKKVILSAVFAAIILSISGCQDYQERKQDYKKPDINRPGNPQRFEKF